MPCYRIVSSGLRPKPFADSDGDKPGDMELGSGKFGMDSAERFNEQIEAFNGYERSNETETYLVRNG